MPAVQLTFDQIRLGDVITLEPITAYHTATVKAIRDGKITLFRPYVQTADFSMGASVICYIGIEEFDVYPRAGELFNVVQRVELK